MDAGGPAWAVTAELRTVKYRVGGSSLTSAGSPALQSGLTNTATAFSFTFIAPAAAP